MSRSEFSDICEFDPEIERTFHQRRHEERARKEEQLNNMGDNANQLIQMAQPVEVNERDILIGDFMMPPMIENRSSIIYPPYS